MKEPPSSSEPPGSISDNISEFVCTIKQTCQELTLSRTTVWKLIKSGKLKSKRVGRRVLVPRKAIKEFAEE
jgi:excisionase family DNA binding protein